MANKVTICHWANGNPHTIEVAEPAAKNHINHAGIGVPGHEEDTLGPCLTPTTTPTTVPVSPTTTTTTTTITTTKGGENTTTPTSESPVSTITSTTPVLGCTTVDGHPFLTNIEQGGCPAPIAGETAVLVPTSPVSRDALPATGVDAGALALVGVAAIIIGRLIRRATR